VVRLDHLILVAPSLEAGMAEMEVKLGVRAVLGGKHPGRGTHPSAARPVWNVRAGWSSCARREP
jgi:hypothetical protein